MYRDVHISEFFACQKPKYVLRLRVYILIGNPGNVYTTGCRLLIALLVLSSYPLQCHPARRSILNLVAAMIDGQQIDLCRRSPRGRNGESNSSPFALLDNHSPTSDGTYVITTTTSRSSAALAEGAAFPDDGAMNSPAIASMLTLNGPDAETLQSRYNKTTVCSQSYVTAPLHKYEQNKHADRS
jgi:hypothetical protein